MPVCFLSYLHTSSASSGSPVLNANGELIGLNFDRIAEGVTSDYKFFTLFLQKYCSGYQICFILTREIFSLETPVK